MVEISTSSRKKHLPKHWSSSFFIHGWFYSMILYGHIVLSESNKPHRIFGVYCDILHINYFGTMKNVIYTCTKCTCNDWKQVHQCMICLRWFDLMLFITFWWSCYWDMASQPWITLKVYWNDIREQFCFLVIPLLVHEATYKMCSFDPET